MPRSKKEFVVNLLCDKDVSYIKENFNYVVEMFESGEQEDIANAVKEVKPVAKQIAPKKATVISESKASEVTATSGAVGGYLTELKKLTK
jgi:hypothetical protein